MAPKAKQTPRGVVKKQALNMGKAAPQVAPHLTDMRLARWKHGQQLTKAKRTIASLRAELERSNKEHKEHKARLRELSCRSYELIQESYAEDWMWRKKYRTLYKKHWEPVMTTNNLQRVGDTFLDIDPMAANEEEDDEFGRPEGSEPLGRLSYLCDAIDVLAGDDDDEHEAHPLLVGTIVVAQETVPLGNDGGDGGSPLCENNTLEDEATDDVPVALARVVLLGSSASQERSTCNGELVTRQQIQESQRRRFLPIATQTSPLTESYRKWRGRQRNALWHFSRACSAQNGARSSRLIQKRNQHLQRISQAGKPTQTKWLTC